MVHFKQKRCWKSTLVPIYEGGTSALLPKTAAPKATARNILKAAGSCCRIRNIDRISLLTCRSNCRALGTARKHCSHTPACPALLLNRLNLARQLATAVWQQQCSNRAHRRRSETPTSHHMLFLPQDPAMCTVHTLPDTCHTSTAWRGGMLAHAHSPPAYTSPSSCATCRLEQNPDTGVARGRPNGSRDRVPLCMVHTGKGGRSTCAECRNTVLPLRATHIPLFSRPLTHKHPCKQKIYTQALVRRSTRTTVLHAHPQ